MSAEQPDPTPPDRTPPQPPPVARRVALVTGGGRGIGRAVALALAADGHPIGVTARSGDEIAAVADEIRAAGGRAHDAAGDITDPADVERVVAAVTDALGPPAIVVNNAGTAESHTLAGHPDELWHRMLAVNLTGAYLVTKACAPALLERGWGRVISIGSVASLTGAPYIAAYTAAKHGLLGLTRALAAEWVRKGVTANLVAPGYVDTALTDATVDNIAARTAMDDEAARDTVRRLSPQHQLITPAEITPAVRWLASEAAGAVTGTVIAIDGGASALAAKG